MFQARYYRYCAKYQRQLARAIKRFATLRCFHTLTLISNLRRNGNASNSLDKIAHLGQVGDKVEVKSGFARNFLIPQGKSSYGDQSKY